MATYIERTDEGYLIQVTRFCERVDTHAGVLGLDPAKVAAIKADNEFFRKTYLYMENFRGFAESFTNYKELLRHGKGDEVLGPFPVAPVIETPAPTPTFANAQKRFAGIIGDCTNSSNYTKNIGEDLGIEAPVTPFNPADGQPVLKPGMSTGGHPELKWKKGKFDGIEIWIDRGDGKGWVFLDKDMRPDFTDKITPLPAAGASAVWKYRAIYLYKGEQVGQWSATVTVTVHGIE